MCVSVVCLNYFEKNSNFFLIFLRCDKDEETPQSFHMLMNDTTTNTDGIGSGKRVSSKTPMAAATLAGRRAAKTESSKVSWHNSQFLTFRSLLWLLVAVWSSASERYQFSFFVLPFYFFRCHAKLFCFITLPPICCCCSLSCDIKFIIFMEIAVSMYKCFATNCWECNNNEEMVKN